MEEQFRHIIDEHNGILYKIGRSYTRDEADFQDLYQEMLIQLWESYPRFQGQSKLSTWIYRVVLNTALTHSKKAKRRPNASPLEGHAYRLADESAKEQSEKYTAEQQVQLLYQCINELKKDQRAIVLLHLEGNSYEEIAEIMGVTVSNVGVRLLRSKKKLQRLLTAKGYGRV